MRRICEFPHGEVWWCDLRRPAATALLSSEERARAARFIFPRDRERYLASHAALRKLLEDNGAPPAQAFSTGPHGKPQLPAFPWRFNLSHSGDEALIALSPSRDIGIDIEVVKPIDLIEDLAHQYFSPRELDTWFDLGESARQQAFFELWSRKEACVKATGWGLNLPLRRFDVGFADPRPREVELPLPTGAYARMTLMSLSLDTGSAAALAWLA